jgi:hypothetical protein
MGTQVSAIPESILALVERFGRQQQAYRSGQYNETQLRREFLDPFWEALGWDVNNRQGYAEAYKDVIHEDAIKVGGVTKAPDYCSTGSFLLHFMTFCDQPHCDGEAADQEEFCQVRYAPTKDEK